MGQYGLCRMHKLKWLCGFGFLQMVILQFFMNLLTFLSYFSFFTDIFANYQRRKFRVWLPTRYFVFILLYLSVITMNCIAGPYYAYGPCLWCSTDVIMTRQYWWSSLTLCIGKKTTIPCTTHYTKHWQLLTNIQWKISTRYCGLGRILQTMLRKSVWRPKRLIPVSMKCSHSNQHLYHQRNSISVESPYQTWKSRLLNFLPWSLRY